MTASKPTAGQQLRNLIDDDEQLEQKPVIQGKSFSPQASQPVEREKIDRRLTVKITPSMEQSLINLANEEVTTVSELVRQILKREIRSNTNRRGK